MLFYSSVTLTVLSTLINSNILYQDCDGDFEHNEGRL